MLSGKPLALLLALAAGLVATPALARMAPPAPPTEVSPLIVWPHTEPPAITATFPAAGQAIAPGVLVLSVTFDQPMLKTGFDYASAPGGEMPDCLKTPLLLASGKTFVLLCRTLPGKTYALTFNVQAGEAGAAPAPGGFANMAEKRAKPASLTFTTTADEPVRSMDAALKAASLTAADMPVQETPGLAPAGQ